ncbi:MAG: hypothetical protein LBC42_02270, partial [Puniceicoccales bacterium]|nr:hypothetical protein [Puniceicoccales bacterium]
MDFSPLDRYARGTRASPQLAIADQEQNDICYQILADESIAGSRHEGCERDIALEKMRNIWGTISRNVLQESVEKKAATSVRNMLDTALQIDQFLKLFDSLVVKLGNLCSAMFAYAKNETYANKEKAVRIFNEIDFLKQTFEDFRTFSIFFANSEKTSKLGPFPTLFRICGAMLRKGVLKLPKDLYQQAEQFIKLLLLDDEQKLQLPILIDAGFIKHGVYFYIKKCGDKIIVQECNKGGASSSSSVASSTKYVTCGTPGYLFSTDLKGLRMVVRDICALRCHVFDATYTLLEDSVAGSTAMSRYERQFTAMENANPVRLDTVPWRVFSKVRAQRSGNCAFFSAQVAISVAFADQLVEYCNANSVQAPSNERLLGYARLFNVFSRLIVLEETFTSLQEQPVPPRDSILLLRRGLDRVCHHYNRFLAENERTGERGAESTLTPMFAKLYDEVSAFIDSPKVQQAMIIAGPCIDVEREIVKDPVKIPDSRMSIPEAVRGQQLPYEHVSIPRDEILDPKTVLSLLNGLTKHIERFDELGFRDSVRREIFMRIAEVMRKVPLPDSDAFAQWRQNVTPNMQRDLCRAFSIFIECFGCGRSDRLSPKVRAKKIEGQRPHQPTNSSSPQSPDETIQGQIREFEGENLLYAESGPCMNAIAKMRIVALELDLLARGHAQYSILDNRASHDLYKSFCGTLLCFFQTEEDRIEQHRILQFLSNSRTYATFEICSRFSGDKNTSLLLSDIFRERRMHGLFKTVADSLPSAVAHLRTSIKSGRNTPNEQYLLDFITIMFHGMPFAADEDNETIHVQPYISCHSFTGYLGSENDLRNDELKAQQERESDAIAYAHALAQIPVEENRTTNLLLFFRENLHIFAGYGLRKNSLYGCFGEIGGKRLKIPQVVNGEELLHLLIQILTYRNARSRSAETALEKDAREMPHELLEAIIALWHDGKRFFCDEWNVKSPKIAPMCAVSHVTHTIFRALICACDGTSPILTDIQAIITERLQEFRRILRDSHEGALLKPTSLEEEKLLRIAENECAVELFRIYEKNPDLFSLRELPTDVLEALVANVFYLQSCSTFSIFKGSIFAMRGIAEKLEWYWVEHPQQSLAVARKIYEIAARQPPTDELRQLDGGCTFADDRTRDYVDLLIPQVIVRGDEIRPCIITFTDEKYVTLFGKKEREMFVVKQENGCEYHFNDSVFGEVTISIRESSEIAIYRTIDGKKWLYICKDEVSTYGLPSALFGSISNFSVWISADQKPGDQLEQMKIFRESTLCFDMENGRMRSCLPDDNGYNVRFCREISGTEISAFSRFAPVTSDQKRDGFRPFYALCDESGETKEIVFPLMYDTANIRLSFTLNNGEWCLKTDLNWKVCESPRYSCLDEGGLPVLSEEKLTGSPLINFDTCLWLYNRKSDTYKCLIPQVKITRPKNVGISCSIAAEPVPLIRRNRTFCGEVFIAEILFYENPLDFVAPQLVPQSSAARVILAHIYQAQSHYELAIEQLRSISSVERCMTLFDIVSWFIEGHEKSAHTAVIAAYAMFALLKEGWSYNHALQQILFEDIPWTAFVQTLLQGVDVCAMRPDEELHFWRLLTATYSLTPAMCSQEIDMRIKDLETIIRHRDAVITFESPEVDRLDEELKFQMLLQQRAIDRVAATDLILEARSDLVSAKSEFSVLGRVRETKLCRFTDRPEDVVLPEETLKLEGPQLSDVEKQKFGAELEKQLLDFNHEIELGLQQLAQRRNDQYLMARVEGPNIVVQESTIVTVEEFARLRDFISEQISIAFQTAKEAAKAMQSIANTNFFASTLGAPPWRKLKITDAIRWLYGPSIVGQRSAALKYAREKHPGFRDEYLDPLNAATETYIISVTEMRYLRGIVQLLDVVLNQDCSRDDIVRTNALKKVVLALRSLHGGNFPHDKLDRLAMLFEYMTQLRPRQDQMNKIDFILERCTEPGNGALIQQMMGSGKSKVLTPFLIMFAVFEGEKMPIIVPHSSQIASTIKELAPILANIGIRLENLSINFSALLDIRVLQQVLSKLQLALATSEYVPVMTSTTALALQALKYTLRGSDEIPLPEENFKTHFKTDIVRHLPNQKDFQEACLNLSKEVLLLLRTRYMSVLDEIHLTVNPKYAFIIQKSDRSHNVYKIPPEDVAFLTHIIHTFPPTLLDAIRSNTHSVLSPDIINAEFSKILETYADHFKIVQYGREITKTFFDFMLGKTDGHPPEEHQ